MTLLKQLMIQDKMRGVSLCEENRVGESQVAERQRKRMCKRWSVQERRIEWVKDKDILTVSDRNVI
jgi:hypothetical protein